MKILNEKKEYERFLKFAFVGITGTIVDFGAMNFLMLVFHLPLVWAQGISFSLGVLNNFLWNRYWTYPDSRSKNTAQQFIQFGLINIVGILIRTPLIGWFDRTIFRVLNNAALPLPIANYIISQNLALALSIFIVLFWNYFANRFWTYNDVRVSVNQNHITEENNKNQ